jgi:hypothetical protein
MRLSRRSGLRRGGTRGATLLVAALLAITVTMLGGCGSDEPDEPPGIVDPAARAQPATLPDWFPRRFVAPAGSAVVDVINRPEPGLGRTVTWRVPGDFDEVLGQVETVVRNLGWQPTERTEAADEGARRTSLFIENSEVYAVRVYEDDTLDGVRLTVELPADR